MNLHIIYLLISILDLSVYFVVLGPLLLTRVRYVSVQVVYLCNVVFLMSSSPNLWNLLGKMPKIMLTIDDIACVQTDLFSTILFLLVYVRVGMIHDFSDLILFCLSPIQLQLIQFSFNITLRLRYRLNNPIPFVCVCVLLKHSYALFGNIKICLFDMLNDINDHETKLHEG